MRLGRVVLRENETWLRPKGTVLGWLAGCLVEMVGRAAAYTPHADERPRRSRYDTYNGKPAETPAIMKCKTHFQKAPFKAPANAGLCYQTP